jgi:catechol 2,3-dioxygenase-like lactoylglutathione lyase family enzyme
MREKLCRLVPELICTDCKTSLAFYVDLLGFKIVYDRPEEGFAYLDRDGAQIMLDQLVPDDKRSWITGPLERPFGRGINLEIRVDDVEALYARVLTEGAPVFLPIEDKWYRAGSIEVGCRQFIVQDPDGYLIRMQGKIGERPYAKAE